MMLSPPLIRQYAVLVAKKLNRDSYPMAYVKEAVEANREGVAHPLLTLIHTHFNSQLSLEVVSEETLIKRRCDRVNHSLYLSAIRQGVDGFTGQCISHGAAEFKLTHNRLAYRCCLCG